MMYSVSLTLSPRWEFLLHSRRRNRYSLVTIVLNLSRDRPPGLPGVILIPAAGNEYICLTCRSGRPRLSRLSHAGLGAATSLHFPNCGQRFEGLALKPKAKDHRFHLMGLKARQELWVDSVEVHWMKVLAYW